MKRHGGNLTCIFPSERSQSERVAYFSILFTFKTYFRWGLHCCMGFSPVAEAGAPLWLWGSGSHCRVLLQSRGTGCVGPVVADLRL